MGKTVGREHGKGANEGREPPTANKKGEAAKSGGITRGQLFKTTSALKKLSKGSKDGG